MTPIALNAPMLLRRHTIFVGFSAPKRFNPISAIVKLFTKSKASHTFFFYWNVLLDMHVVLEAHELGFREIPLNLFEKSNNIIAVFEPKTDILPGVRHVAKRFLGRAYDYGGLVGSAFVLLGRFLKRKWHNPLNSAASVFCSEAVVVALQESGYQNADKLVAHDTTPQDLLEFFREN